MANQDDAIEPVIINGKSIDVLEIINRFGEKKIEAIKYLRDFAGISSKESIAIIDSAYKKLGTYEKEPIYNATPKSSSISDDTIRCPRCGSTQITANKKGYGVGKAAAGVILTGGIGLLAGGIGSNKVIITCLKCGHKFKPGHGA